MLSQSRRVCSIKREHCARSVLEILSTECEYCILFSQLFDTFSSISALVFVNLLFYFWLMSFPLQYFDFVDNGRMGVIRGIPQTAACMTAVLPLAYIH